MSETPLATTQAPVQLETTDLTRLTPEQIDARVHAIERAAEAHKRIVMATVKMTRPKHWKDFGGKPYLDGDGALALAKIGLKISEPVFEVQEVDTDRVVECTVLISWPEMCQEHWGLGSCSTRDKFFANTGEGCQYNQYLKQAGGNERLAKVLLLGHVKKKAYQNALSRGVRGVLGLLGITWEELGEVGITREGAGARVDYKKDGRAAKPAGKTAATVPLKELLSLPVGSVVSVRGTIERASKSGKRNAFHIGVDDLKAWIVRWSDPEVPMWAGDSLPEWAKPGTFVFCESVKVGEYQGNKQFVARDITPVEPEPSEEPNDTPDNQ